MSRGVAEPGSFGGGDGLPAVAGRDTARTLTEVLADYQECAVFARYLVQHGAGNGSYHAALFGYCYLNDLRHLPAGMERDRLVAPYLCTGEHPADCLSYVTDDGAGHLSDDAVDGMFDTVCRHLDAPFARFQAELAAARYAAVPVWPLLLTVRSGPFAWHAELPHAAVLHPVVPDMESGLVHAADAPHTEHVVHADELLSLVLVHDATTFLLTAELPAAAVAAHNDAVLDRLREDRDSCCYLQLDEFVLLYDAGDRDGAALALLQLCCTQQYDAAHPGVIERIGRLGPGRDYFVMHSPAGPDPAVVRSLVAERHAPAKVVVRPF
jgi:hypothetical protein